MGVCVDYPIRRENDPISVSCNHVCGSSRESGLSFGPSTHGSRSALFRHATLPTPLLGLQGPKATALLWPWISLMLYRVSFSQELLGVDRVA
jgi:hypothetical protein